MLHSTKNVSFIFIYIYKVLLKEKLIHSERNHISVYLFGVEGSDWLQRSKRNLYGSNENVLYFNWAGSYIGIKCFRTHQTMYKNIFILSSQIFQFYKKKWGRLTIINWFADKGVKILYNSKFWNYEKDPAEYSFILRGT